ncbi:ammonium transporter like protein [Zymoseptoria brevis]|uniref:Ammonium transporter n=1 Tax=Zymoseptoria brevis TaxID=1047168 RepID=A0A0F4GRI0_9PEZI|nr:ammonium transporter like protein [Zymoseptoria brevis]
MSSPAEVYSEMFPVPKYDPSMPRGGNTLEVNVNDQYTGHEFHYVYLTVCAFLVWMIIPGIGLLYSGLARRKSSLALLFQSLMVVAVVAFQWMFWGYSLAYSRTGNAFIGNLDNFGLMGVRVAPSPGNAFLPEIIFCFYQLLFCAVTVQLVIGGAFERGGILASLLFSFIWATIVYCPVANWTWNANGWLYNLGELDFAGGGPVHIASGCASLAYALILGKRQVKSEIGRGRTKPHNASLVWLGTMLIWFGWFGFNGGSALNASVRSLYVVFNTNTAASTGVLGWVLVDMIRNKGKFSVTGACEGAIAGLVGITPAAGYVNFWLAALIGFLTGIVCSSLHDLNDWLNVDEGLDVFKLHGIGGMVGSFLTGIFADAPIGALDYELEIAGAINGNGVQIGYNLAGIVAIAAYSFTMTSIILLVLKYIPGVGLRVSAEDEMMGLDAVHFADEEIGDWEYMKGTRSTLNGRDVAEQSRRVSSAGSKEREAESTSATSPGRAMV